MCFSFRCPTDTRFGLSPPGIDKLYPGECELAFANEDPGFTRNHLEGAFLTPGI